MIRLKEKKEQGATGMSEEQLMLLEEIRQAHDNWLVAQQRLDWAYESQEEIDYAILSLAAAEKKYDLLLKQAKALDWSTAPFRVL